MATDKSERASTRTEKLTIPFVEGITWADAWKASGGKDGATGDCAIYDSEQPGLALRISPGSKTWIVRRKLRGKSFRHVLGHFPEMTLAKARKAAEKAIGTFAEGRHPTLEREARKEATNAEWLANSFTVAQMWADYRDQVREGEPFSGNYVRDFARMEKRMGGDPIWVASFAQLSEDEVRAAFKRTCAAAAKNPRASNGGKTTANSCFRMLRSAAQFAIKKEKVASGRNMFSIAMEKNWHKSKPRKRTIVAEEDGLLRWWTAVDALRAKGQASAKYWASATLADFQVLVLLWGGRKTETLCLRWVDVDFKRRTVKFREEVTKNHEEHIFPLCPHAELVFRRLEATRDKWTPESEWVFPSSRTGWRTKTKTHIKEPANAMREVAEAAKVPFSTHDLRRTFSNLMSSSAGVGAEQVFVKMAMNHSVVDVTAEHYMEKVAQLRPLYERFEEIVLERVGLAAPKKIEVDADAYRRFLEFESNVEKKGKRRSFA